jgi:membrane-associated phospholipid phosphatase
LKPLVKLYLSLAIAAYGQTALDQGPATEEEARAATASTSPDQAPPDQPPPSPGPTPQTGTPSQQQNRSALGVAPGTQAIKDKDLYEQSGMLHPFRRMPKFALTDQEKIWTSPFHTSHKDIKWWAIFGGATAALIAADQHIEKAAPTNSTLVHLGDDVSYLGTAYTLIPIAGTFYLIGSARHDEHFRETGLLSFETLVAATVVLESMKSVADRERPTEGSGEGHFFASPNARYNSSFPSGHSMETFALASVFAHEYHDKFWVKFLAYAYAGGVVGARLAAKQHFPGDVLAGGAMGWFIGDYVYGRRHNPELDKGVVKKVISHVQFAPAW